MPRQLIAFSVNSERDELILMLEKIMGLSGMYSWRNPPEVVLLSRRSDGRIFLSANTTDFNNWRDAAAINPQSYIEIPMTDTARLMEWKLGAL